jgi:hypothetical protein
MTYFVTPRALNLISTRSESPYWDKLVMCAIVSTGGAVSPTALPVDMFNPPKNIREIRVAYLGLHGNGSVITLKNEYLQWGVGGDWRIPIPEDVEEPLFLSLIARNVRGVQDDRWKQCKRSVKDGLAGSGSL